MFLNKAYKKARMSRDESPCEFCMYCSLDCTHIPVNLCVLYGGFKNANEEIFKI